MSQVEDSYSSDSSHKLSSRPYADSRAKMESNWRTEKATVRDYKTFNRRKSKHLNKTVSPDVIGTLTAATAGGILLIGVPFGIPGIIVGGTLGLALGLYNERANLRRH